MSQILAIFSTRGVLGAAGVEKIDGSVAAGLVLAGGAELALVLLASSTGRRPVDGGLVRLGTLRSVRFLVLISAIFPSHLSQLSHNLSRVPSERRLQSTIHDDSALQLTT
jgi:hypothetical protein